MLVFHGVLDDAFVSSVSASGIPDYVGARTHTLGNVNTFPAEHVSVTSSIDLSRGM